MNVGITSAFVVTTIAGVLSNGLQKAAGHDDEDKGNETGCVPRTGRMGQPGQLSNLEAIVARRYGAVWHHRLDLQLWGCGSFRGQSLLPEPPLKD